MTPSPLATVVPPALESVWDYAWRGGFMMIPILVCSLAMLTIALERTVALRRRRVLPSGIAGALDDATRGAARPLLERIAGDSSPLSRVLHAGARRRDDGREAVVGAMREAGARAAALMRRNLRGLSVIASVAPLLGLLGTILGMIEAFRTVAGSADALGRTEMLADGIYAAMITTAAGLVVAIPALVLHQWLAARVQARLLDIDAAAERFADEVLFAPARPRLVPADDDRDDAPAPPVAAIR